MEQQLKDQFEGLLEKYTELLLGESSDELKEKVKMWALYTHISKSMPPLAKHWNSTYPEAKEDLKSIIGEIKDLNEQFRQINKKD
ncbi:YusU family protein [Metabacillus litoralis]|uniref:YusU family protein n=1 Tax=Metabacillus TaxID=2675233 RepID=UPI00203F578F|nr:YusU family protein [Metabacillus litoralis]MCM3161222.1 YusU family protein [Metabacillus litoralis]